VGTKAHTNKGMVLVLACAAQFMVVLDVAIVNVALPSIQQDLGIGQNTLQWIIIAYGLMLGGFLLLGGRMADLLGRRRMLLTGLTLFSFASLLAGVARSAELLIGARALQGFGAAPGRDPLSDVGRRGQLRGHVGRRADAAASGRPGGSVPPARLRAGPVGPVGSDGNERRRDRLPLDPDSLYDRPADKQHRHHARAGPPRGVPGRRRRLMSVVAEICRCGWPRGDGREGTHQGQGRSTDK
jgi:hypothetical protein